MGIMVKKKKQNKLIIALILVVLLVVSYFSGLFSLISPNLTEEGFYARDVLRESGTYNPELLNTEYETGFYGEYTNEAWYDKQIAMSGSDVIISGAGRNLANWIRSGGDTACTYSRRDSSETICLTTPFDFPITYESEHIIEFRSILHKGTDRAYAHGTNSIQVNGNNVFVMTGGYLKNNAIPNYDGDTYAQYLDGTLQIKWTSYQNGQYQVFLDGKAVTEILTAPDNKIDIRFIPSKLYGSTNYGQFIISRDDMRQLFRCDPQEGEVLADMVFKEEDFDTTDLIGFKSFCSNIPALLNDGGVISSDNRVYYNLAEGGLERLGTNQAYRIFYIADGVEVGALNCSSGDSYSVNEGECADTTGFASICSSDSILINNVCVTKIIDEVDMVSRAEIVGDKTISWTATGVKPTFSSLGELLFSVSTPIYSCRETDGHEDKDRINYPQPSEDCWAFTLNDEPISVGQTQQVNQYWSISFESASASLRYDLEDGQNGIFEEDDDWGMSMQIVLDNPFVGISATLPSQLELGEAGDVEIEFDNQLNSEVSGIVEIVVTPDIIDNTLTITKDVSLPSGSSLQSVSLPTAYLGNSEALIFFTLRTDAGNILASDVYSASYDVVKVVEDTGTQPIEETNEEVDVSQDTIEDSGIGVTIMIILVMLVLISTFFVFNKKKGGKK